MNPVHSTRSASDLAREFNKLQLESLLVAHENLHKLRVENASLKGTLKSTQEQLADMTIKFQDCTAELQRTREAEKKMRGEVAGYASATLKLVSLSGGFEMANDVM